MRTVAAFAWAFLACTCAVSCKAKEPLSSEGASASGRIGGTGGGGSGPRAAGSDRSEAGIPALRPPSPRSGWDRVTVQEWGLEGSSDVLGRITFGCFVPSSGRLQPGRSHLDMFVSQDGRCLVWYVHVWASREWVRVTSYRLSEASTDGTRRVETTVFDPVCLNAAGAKVPAERTADELFGIDRSPSGGRREVQPLGQDFPLLLEWQITKVVAPDERPKWLPAGDPRIALQGSVRVDKDHPLPPEGELSQPSYRLQLCEADLRQLLKVLGAGQRSDVLDVLFRVGLAPGAVVPGGFIADPPTQFETRVPITRERIDRCLGAQ